MLELLVLIVAMSGEGATVEAGGVRIDSRLDSGSYVWTVTNVDAPPVSAFEIRLYEPHTHQVPDGWVVEEHDGLLHVRAAAPGAAIRPGQSREFRTRANSPSGAIGLGTARLEFDGDAAPLELDGVWTCVRQPRQHILLIAVALMALATLHTVLAGRRPPRAAIAAALLALPVLAAGGCATAAGPERGFVQVYAQDFTAPDAGADFVFSDPAAWRLAEAGGRAALEHHRPSDYAPPHRAPRNVALLASPCVGSFVLEAELRSTAREYDHGDLCLFFNVQGPDRYYYAHLARRADAVAHHVHIVDRADRRPITLRRSEGVDWSDGWHHVRLERDATSGLIQVFLDHGPEPVLVAEDRTFVEGWIGFGSFDDTGLVTGVRLRAPSSSAARPTFFRPLAPPADRAP